MNTFTLTNIKGLPVNGSWIDDYNEYAAPILGAEEAEQIIENIINEI